MADIKFRLFYGDDVANAIDSVDVELDDVSPRKKEFMLLWLREKGKRVKVGNESRELPLYQGTELVDNMVRAVRDEYFPEFDRQYMDWLYDCARSDGFSEDTRQMLTEYMDEKRTLAEISHLMEHLMPNESVATIMKVLREEPKNSWYEELVADCEDSVVLRSYYAKVFGVAEHEVFPPLPDKLPEPKTIAYMILSEGAEPEPVMFIKNIKDHKTDKTLSVFCHGNPVNEGELEYFTVTQDEAPYLPMAMWAENDSNMDRLVLWAKELTDFSDDVYLEKPTASDIAARYQRKRIGNGKRFQKDIHTLLDKFQQAKVWTFGKGESGKMVAEAPAYAKFVAYRNLMEHFEMNGNYNVPTKKLIAQMQDEVHDQHMLVEGIFNSMKLFTVRSAAMEKYQSLTETKERETSLLRPKESEHTVSVEK